MTEGYNIKLLPNDNRTTINSVVGKHPGSDED